MLATLQTRPHIDHKPASVNIDNTVTHLFNDAKFCNNSGAHWLIFIIKKSTQTDKISIYAKINFSCQTVNFLTNGVLLTVYVANQKERKAIGNVRVNLNKIHVYGCLLRLYVFSPHFNPAINHFGGFVIVKIKLTSVFYAARGFTTLTKLWRNLSSTGGQTHEKLTSIF